MRHSDDASSRPDAPRPAALPRAPRRLGRLRWVAGAAALAGALFLGACEGDNIFSGASESAQPRIVGIATSPIAVPGDTLTVQVSAYAPRKVSHIAVSLRGGVLQDTMVDVEASPSVVQAIRIPLPVLIRDTFVVVSAAALDSAGVTSKFRTDTIPAIAPPQVLSISGPNPGDAIQPGSAVIFHVYARGAKNRRITALQFALRGAMTADTTVAVQVPDSVVQQDAIFLVPASVADSTLQVAVAAMDDQRQLGYTYSTTFRVAVPAPEIVGFTVNDANLRAGGSIDLDLEAQSPRGIKRFDIAVRGAFTRDTSIVVSTPLTSVVQSVRIPIPANVLGSSVTVSVTAVDMAGISGQPSVRDLTLPAGSPRIDSFSASSSVAPGGILDVSIAASASRPITRLELSMRGALNRDTAIVFSSGGTSVSRQLAIAIPDTVHGTSITLSARAVDAAGVASPDGSVRYVDVVDPGLPQVTATLSDLAPVVGTAVTLTIKAQAGTGLQTIGYRITTDGGAVLREDEVPVSGASLTKTFVFPFTSAVTSNIQAYAVDSAGNEGVAPTIVVVPTAAATTGAHSPATGPTP